MKTRVLFVALLIVILTGVLGIGSVVSAAESAQQSQFVAPIMVVNTSFLNVRTGPGTQYTVLITVVGGTELPVLGVYKDRVWYQVSTVAGPGWINFEYALPRGNFGNVPFVEAPEAVMEDVDLTVEAAQVPRGANFASSRAWGVSVIETHWSRFYPTITQGGTLGQVHADENVIFALIEGSGGDGIFWYRVDIPDIGLAWIEAPKSLLRPFGCQDYVARMISETTLRLGPDGSGTIDGTLSLPVGQEAYIVADLAGQYKLELFDGNTGWVPRGAVEVREPGTIRSSFCATGRVSGSTGSTATDSGGTGQPARITSTARVVINTGFLNVRSGPGSQYSSVTTVPGGTELAVIGFAPDRVWYLVEGTFGRGWVNSEFTLFRGDGRNIPIVRDFVGAAVSQPMASITNAVILYTAPNTTLGVIGAISGPLDVAIVARTAAGDWVQINTVLGFGWVRASEVTINGDLNLAPIVG